MVRVNNLPATTDSAFLGITKKLLFINVILQRKTQLPLAVGIQYGCHRGRHNQVIYYK